MRWKTDVPGLYLSGQDVVYPTVIAGLLGGVITAGEVLDRSTILDFAALHHYLETSNKTNKPERVAMKDFMFIRQTSQG